MMRIIPVRLLVVDDDEAVGRRVCGWLRDAAYDAVAFTRPAEALAHVANAPCQAALADLHLAAEDGAGLLGALHSAAPDMRLIAVTAFPEPAQIVAAMRAGARDLLEKPLQPEPVLAAVARQLAELGLPVRSEEEFNRRLGARLRTLRTLAERTLADVASDCGLTVAQLSALELGRNGASVWSLARIAAALRTPLERLLAGI